MTVSHISTSVKLWLKLLADFQAIHIEIFVGYPEH